MPTMTDTASDCKTPLAERVRTFLAGQGYDPATIELSRRRPSVLVPADYAAVRLIVDGPTPAPTSEPYEVDCLEWASATAHDRLAPTRLRELAIAMLNEDGLSGRFVPPTMTDPERWVQDREVAAATVRANRASTLPDAYGQGLTRGELMAVNGARNDATYRASWFSDDNADPYPIQCGRTAASAMLRVVLARRPRFGAMGKPGTAQAAIDTFLRICLER